MDASHDKGETGFPVDARRAVIERLEKVGRVFLSCEGGVPAEWSRLAYKLAPHRMHDFLAFASMCVGDSGTMAAEAAYLGTPALFTSTFAGRLALLDELERYGLMWSYHPRDAHKFLEKLDALLAPIAAGEDAHVALATGRARMLNDTVDVAKWFTDFLEGLGR